MTVVPVLQIIQELQNVDVGWISRYGLLQTAKTVA